MGEDYWNASSVTKKVSQQAIFDTDSSVDRFKNRSDPIVDRIIESSRSTPPVSTTGAISNRYRPTTSTPTPVAIPTVPKANDTTQIVKRPNSTIQQTVTNPTAQRTQSVDPNVESTRFGRSPATGSSNDLHSNAQWLPQAEDYPEQNGKDRTTQYDKEMELLCKKLLENKKVDLSNIREYDRKASLLRMAVSFNTPTVTVPVILFLENTLTRKLFYELIKNYPSAINNYVNLAKFRLDHEYYIPMLEQFGRTEDVAMLRLRQASKVHDLNAKLSLLDEAASKLGSHPWWHLQIAEQRLLVKKQQELLDPRKNQTTLGLYKIIYEDEFKKQKQVRANDKSVFDRSEKFETTFHMCPEIIMCGKLSAIMQCGIQQHYEDFVHQAIHQGFFGKKYIIAPEYIADMINNWVLASGEPQHKAGERAERFLNMISDPVRRIYYAEKLQNFDVAMDVIMNTSRDRMELENLRKRMPRDHPAFNRATALLDSGKFKNQNKN